MPHHQSLCLEEINAKFEADCYFVKRNILKLINNTNLNENTVRILYTYQVNGQVMCEKQSFLRLVQQFGNIHENETVLIRNVFILKNVISEE
jgi:hypothetical protein